MDKIDFKVLAKTFSNEVLFDLICNQKTSKEDLDIYMNEVKERGIERELFEIIRKKEDKKNLIKDSVKELSKETLFTIVLYNIERFEEDDLIIFKNEIENRGLGKELSEAIKLKEADDLNFKNSVLNNSSSPEEVLNDFNKYMLSKTPQMEPSAEKKKNSLTNIILGLVLIFIGVFLTFLMEGDLIFYGAILVGVLLIVKDITKVIKS